jgi:hypothetical protein
MLKRGREGKVMSTTNETNGRHIGVNQQILETLSRNPTVLSRYDLSEYNDDMTEFLTQNNLETKNKSAKSITEKALKRHRKDERFGPILSDLARIEFGVQHFDEYLRDHVSHPVYVYLLGLLLMTEVPVFRKIDALTWKLAALLHDVGYPPQLFLTSLKQYVDKATQTGDNRDSLCQYKYVFSLVGPQKLVFHDQDTFSAINGKLRSWNIRLNLLKAHRNFLRIGEINHGILSSLIVTKVIDYLYHEKNHDRSETKLDDFDVDWGWSCFRTQILDAAAAISIHDILGKYQRTRLSANKQCVAYLLVLCDTIQQWDRPQQQRVIRPEDVEITLTEHSIHCRLSNLPPDKANDVRVVISKLKPFDPRLDIEIDPSTPDPRIH